MPVRVTVNVGLPLPVALTLLLATFVYVVLVAEFQRMPELSCPQFALGGFDAELSALAI